MNVQAALAAEFKTTVNAGNMAVTRHCVQVERLFRREVHIAWKAVIVMFVGDLVADHVPHIPEGLLAA
jgi:hypothetical protein